MRQAEQRLHEALIAVVLEAVEREPGGIPSLEATCALAERRLAEEPALGQALATLWLSVAVKEALKGVRKASRGLGSRH